MCSSAKAFSRRCRLSPLPRTQARPEPHERVTDFVSGNTTVPSIDIENTNFMCPTSLSTLPTELILFITQHLETEHVAALSLTCKRIHYALRPYYDLLFQDSDAKMRFLRLLELDLPDLYACHGCVRLYFWRDLTRNNGICPRYFSSRSRGNFYENISWLMTERKRPIHVGSLVVDLIIRARRLGPQHSLPLSYLTESSISAEGIHQMEEARIFDEAVIIASCWHMEVQAEMSTWAIERMRKALCRHTTLQWPSGLSSPTMDPTFMLQAGPWKSATRKCEFCESDYKVSVCAQPNGRVKVEVRVW